MVCCIKESSETKGRKINELEICKRVFSSVYLCRNSLQSVYILDGLMDGYPVPYISQTDEDPFVMLAWRCMSVGEMFYPILSGKICLEQKIVSTISNYYISIMQLQFDIPIRLLGTNLYKRMATQT